MTNDDATMLVFATRYCLGRHTYAPSLCCDVLRQRWPELKPGDRDVILRDVRSEVHRAFVERPADPHGMDRLTWRDFLAWAEIQLAYDPNSPQAIAR